MSAKAQVSFDIETWVTVGSTAFQNPQGWASFNLSTGPLSVAAQTVYKITTPATDVFQGLASAEIVTSYMDSPFAPHVPNPYRPGHSYDTMGIMALGSYAAATFRFGQPIAIRPTVLTFASKYTPAGSDSAYVIAFITKWTGTSRDTIARGIYRTGATTSNYSINHITMSYNPLYVSVVPDTQMIYCSSSRYRTVGSKIGSAFYVDAFCWDCTLGINQLNENASISVYPNPASNEINFSSTVNANYIEIYDITSRKFGIYPMQNNKVQIQTETFPLGLYIYDVLNEKKEVISRGKFEVAK